MNREIEFRGIDAETGKFIYSKGVMRFQDGTVVMISNEKDGVISTSPVKPESVGQFTGLTDKNGVKIFEGDIVNSGYFKDCVVVFWHSGWYFKSDIDSHHSFNTAKHSFEVIGNIHNKEVLNG